MTLLRPLSAGIAVARRNVVWLLLGVYALAAVLPAAGEHLRGATLGELPFSADPFNLTHLLLAVLLFGVGLAIRAHDVRDLRSLSQTISRGLAASWLVPVAALAAVCACNTLLGGGWVGGAFLAGAMLVVAMPPANSASAWSELSGGQAAATLWVIVLGTLISPLLTPLVIGGFAAAIGRPELAAAQTSGSLLEVLFAFVMLPAALGVAVRGLLDAISPRWSQVVLEGGRAASLLALLLLNYVNATAALPAVVRAEFPVEALRVAFGTVLLCGLVFAVGVLTARGLRLRDAGERLSFLYVVGMKNTGAALVLATTLLADQPLAVLVPVLYTLAQHLAAALLARWENRGERAAAAVSVREESPLVLSQSWVR